MLSYEPNETPKHGGSLNAAARQYKIPMSDWLDLSTGINPVSWPLSEIPQHVFNRLPEDDDGLDEAARSYFDSQSLIAVAGSQAAIETIPRLRQRSRIGIVSPGYREHAHCWHKQGHEVYLINSDDIEQCIDKLDVLVVINPNNPTGKLYAAEQLLDWHKRLLMRGGWLVVDEAFMDTEPEQTLVRHSHREGLIVLRSLGKFFGLAGIRVGFVFAHKSLLYRLSHVLGPWTLSHPSRFIATQALRDKEWQAQTQNELLHKSEHLIHVLAENGLQVTGNTALFAWVKHDEAKRLCDALALQGILVRYFDDSSLRFGLPKDSVELERLNSGLIMSKYFMGSNHV